MLWLLNETNSLGSEYCLEGTKLAEMLSQFSGGGTNMFFIKLDGKNKELLLFAINPNCPVRQINASVKKFFMMFELNIALLT